MMENFQEAIKKNEKMKIFTRLENYDGAYSIDIRYYYLAEDGDYMPTRRGVKIPVDKVSEFTKIVLKAEKLLKTQNRN